MVGELGLLLVFEEGVMKDLVVNVDLSHLRLHPLPHLLLQTLVLVSSLLSHLGDPCLLNEVWQLEGCLMDAPLVLKVPPLLAPMPRHRH